MRTETTTPVQETNTDLEVRSLDTMCMNDSALAHPWWHNLKYSAWGILFGVVFVKAEIISWFRIQEMFRFESFHMYGVIGTAVVVGAISVLLIRRVQAKTIYGEPVVIPAKPFNKGQITGGLLFGIGWAIAGYCPGPAIAALLINPAEAVPFVLAMLLGAWLQPRWLGR